MRKINPRKIAMLDKSKICAISKDKIFECAYTNFQKNRSLEETNFAIDDLLRLQRKFPKTEFTCDTYSYYDDGIEFINIIHDIKTPSHEALLKSNPTIAMKVFPNEIEQSIRKTYPEITFRSLALHGQEENKPLQFQLLLLGEEALDNQSTFIYWDDGTWLK